MKKENRNSLTESDLNSRRLDAIIRLLIELNKPNPKKKLTLYSTAQILKSCGLKPIEIAHILGKKSATEVAPYLYPKKGKVE
jgi:hypothetical protein